MACNNESNHNSDTTLPSLSANDMFISALPGTWLTLSSYVDGDNPRIRQVMLSDSLTLQEGDACPLPEFAQLSVKPSQLMGVFCQYRLIINDDHQQTVSSTLNLFSSSSPEPTLPELSYAATLNESVYLNFAEVLGEQFPEGFRGRQGTPAMIGDPNNLGSAATKYDGIDFIAPASPGWTRVLYTLESETKTSDTKLGSIYFTFTAQGSEAPEITPAHYDYNEQMSMTVETMQTLTLDLSALEGLSITDDQEWQLLEVSSLTADVEIVDKEQVGTKVFRFNATTPGQHFVSYVVADVHNNISRGVISLNVIAKEQAKTWSNISFEYAQGSRTFTSPPRYSEVIEELKIDAVWDSDVQNTLASFTPTTGQYYCESEGAIPSILEWQTLWERDRAANTVGDRLVNWPKQRSYLAKSADGLGYMLFDLMNKSAEPWTDGQSAYISCVNRHNLELDQILKTVVADNNQYPVVTVFNVKPGVEYDVEALSVNEAAALPELNIEKSAVIDGQFDVMVSTIQAGQFRLRVFNLANPSEQLITQPISIIGDAATTRLTHRFSKDDPEAPSQVELIANDTDVLNVSLDFNDINGNPIADKWYAYSANSENMYTEKPLEQMITDQDGQLMIPMKASLSALDGNNEIDRSFHIDVNGVNQEIVVRVIHPNRYVTVELTTTETARLYTKAHLQVLNANGEPISATLQIAGGESGSIIHFDGSDYVTEIPVPVEGVEVMISMAIDNSPAHIEFALDGSPSRPSVNFPGTLRSSVTFTNMVPGLPQLSGPPTDDDDKQESRDFWKNKMAENDTLCVERYSSNAPYAQDFYPPILGPEDVGKLAVYVNRTDRSVTKLYRIDREFYTAEFLGYNNESVIAYWDGRDWTRLNGNLHPIIRNCNDFFALSTTRN
ncbi:hypothetical protein SO574_07555 [Vibrio alfacsensis]|uniref:hypothetical protein n=1 Tax=Vibrio alfacsensis TaxID=1074311 RepID=UPI002ADDE6F7|nr:hypothetical protein [Vibrio alfacsensis]WQE75084.1 hypothetical protein SO574_07555 [Vibrio alfacsensis]